MVATGYQINQNLCFVSLENQKATCQCGRLDPCSYITYRSRSWTPPSNLICGTSVLSEICWEFCVSWACGRKFVQSIFDFNPSLRLLRVNTVVFLSVTGVNTSGQDRIFEPDSHQRRLLRTWEHQPRVVHQMDQDHDVVWYLLEYSYTK